MARSVPTASAAASPSLQARSPATRIAFGFSLVAAALALLALWAQPRTIGDLYIALAGGRDIVMGKLGQPDDWSFTTNGAVWLNQNWLTHLGYYLAWQAAGPTGLLIVKAVLILCAAAAITLAARERGVPWGFALLVASGVLLAAHGYVDLRPNLTTIVLIPALIGLLYRARRSRGAIWGAMAVMLFWVNAHGGFVFGLGLCGLWAGCDMLCTWRSQGIGAVGRHWPVLLLPAVALGLAAFATPFGVANLWHPLVVARSPAWRTVSEWVPLLGESPFGTAREFFIVAGIYAMATAARFARRLFQRGLAREPGEATAGIFDALAAVVAILMAFSARRMVPVALVVMAPALAVHLHSLLPTGPRRLVTAVLAATIFLCASPMLVRDWRDQRPAHPLYPDETFFERMHRARSFQPADACDFLVANHLSGRAYVEWRWEGMVHWRQPQLQLYLGGRAQQIYREETLAENSRIQSALEQAGGRPDPSLPLRLLEKNRIQFVIIPADATGVLFGSLLFDVRATWAALYFDGHSVVLANVTDPVARGYAEQAAQGELRYADPIIAAWSRALCLSSPPVSASVPDRLELLRLAVAQRPTPLLYSMLISQMYSDPRERAKLLAFVQDEQRRLAALNHHVAESDDLLRCEGRLAETEAGLATGEAARRARQRVEALKGAVRADGE